MGQKGQDHVPAAPELPSDSTTPPTPPSTVYEDQEVMWELSFL